MRRTEKYAFEIGDVVRPRAEWIGDPNNVPSGPVVARAPWGNEGSFYVGDEKRAFAAYVFELVSPRPRGNKAAGDRKIAKENSPARRRSRPRRRMKC